MRQSMMLLGFVLLMGWNPWVKEVRTGVNSSDQQPLVVFLVRHAEKSSATSDPELTDLGKRRATRLADMLQDVAIDQVHSSDFQRTRQTAAPLAKQKGLEVRLYNPRELEILATSLCDLGGKHVVVGHSNTTPQLVKLLGGEAGKPIDDESEYDRLYVLTKAADGTVHSLILRYEP